MKLHVSQTKLYDNNEHKKSIIVGISYIGDASDSTDSARGFQAGHYAFGYNYVAYRGPQKQLTAAPKGYKPFYLSHYGRHGSRYMIGKQAYDVPYFSLLKAKQEPN